MMKALCLPVGASTISVILLKIQRSAQYRRSQSLLILLLILDIRLRRKLKIREGGRIVRLGVPIIVGYLMEIYVLRGVSGTNMTVQFSFGGGPTDVNRMSVTALHCIMTHLFVPLDMFSV